ncbi:MAG: SLC13 family permease [Candidatus Omnitrophota bacterium]
MTKNAISLKFVILVTLAFGIGILSRGIGLTHHQALAISIFFSSILGTLFFWEFRLSFAFLGTSLLLLTRTIDLKNVVEFASLEIILFLVGMMIIIGLLKETGFFAWLVTLLIRKRNLTGRQFIVTLSFLSAFLACAVDEVTSIVFMIAAVLEICDYFEVEPVPFIMTTIFATNIGSAGTVLGNPIGILIASKSGLTFEDFILKAFPLMLVCLLTLIGIVFVAYRKQIKELDDKMKESGGNEMFIKLISIPPEKKLKVSLGIFGTTLLFIMFHHRFEILLGLENNTVLLIMPLIAAALVMIWKWRNARNYVEKDVEWWTLLFFMFLFVQAGTLKYTGTTDVLAARLVNSVGHSSFGLISSVLWITAIGSSMLDNVVLVAGFIPIIHSFQDLGFNLQPLWWALLFGGCLGGNITIIGSTANIVALGILEKERRIKIYFLSWIKIGLIVGLISTAIVWASLTLLPFYR